MNLPVGIIDEKGSIHKLMIEEEMLLDLSKQLRTGPVEIFTTETSGEEKTHMAHGLLLLARSGKVGVMCFPEEMPEEKKEGLH